MGTWVCSQDEERYEGDYESKESAIKCYPLDYDLPAGKVFFVGKLAEYTPSVVTADEILEILSNDAYDHCGEPAEDYLSDVTHEDKKKLESAMNSVLHSWLEDTGYKASFSAVVDVTEHVAPEEEDGGDENNG